MKNLKLTKEEKKLLRSVEAGEWRPVSNMKKEKGRLVKAAKNTREIRRHKDKSITIRINSTDLELIKDKAIHEGLPYQTLIGSILHKYVVKSA